MSKRKTKVVGLRLDLETKSGTDITSGVHPYSEDPEFDILICQFSLIREHPGGGRSLSPIRKLDLANRELVAKFRTLLEDDRLEKHAYNAQFERVCLSRWNGLPTGTYFSPKNWHCSAVRANVNGVFGTLDDVARAVKSPIAKDPMGKSLIRFFSIPMNARDQKKADTTCGCHRFHNPRTHPDEFEKYEAYCAQDVRTEAVVASKFPDVPKLVQREFEADQRINDRGITHDEGLARAAVQQVEVERDRLMSKLAKLTGLANPNSVQQMQGWLAEHGYPMVSLDKEHRESALADPMIPKKVKKALTLKGAASLSSVAKHNAALKTRSDDGRIRGSLRYYGAHTGREAGRGMQPQNLPRDVASELDQELLRQGRAKKRAPEIAKGSVRPSLMARPGHVLVIPDYNAIEARVLGWLAGEDWVNDEFRGDGKIYEATAEMMFNVGKAKIVSEMATCGKCGSCTYCRLRGSGKVSNLALGYAGGAGALVTMGAEREGIDIGNYKILNAEWKASGSKLKFHEWEPDRHDYPALLNLRDLYRAGSPATAGFWKQCATAWDHAALKGRDTRFGDRGVLAMTRDGRHNRMVLPSGRSIWYRFASSVPDPDNPDRVDRRLYTGKGANVGHTRVDTHGGKLTENVTQAVARDVLFDLITRLEKLTNAGKPFATVLHVHDEVVIETPEKHGEKVLEGVLEMMSKPPKWAPDLILKGAGSIMTRYGK